MRYILFAPVHGESPGYAHYDEGTPVPAGAVLYERKPQPGEVWDATTGSLRFPTPAEVLEAAKETKRAEFSKAMTADFKELFPEVDPEDANIRFTLMALSGSDAARVGLVSSLNQKVEEGMAWVALAESVSAVEEMRWEDVPPLALFSARASEPLSAKEKPAPKKNPLVRLWERINATAAQVAALRAQVAELRQSLAEKVDRI